MQFEINTTSKTIKLIGSIKMSELKKLKEFIGKDWNNYTIESASTQYIYTNYPWYYNPSYYTTTGPSTPTVTWSTCSSPISITGTSLVSTNADNVFYTATN